jgi:hypothetical protein
MKGVPLHHNILHWAEIFIVGGGGLDGGLFNVEVNYHLLFLILGFRDDSMLILIQFLRWHWVEIGCIASVSDKLAASIFRVSPLKQNQSQLLILLAAEVTFSQTRWDDNSVTWNWYNYWGSSHLNFSENCPPSWSINAELSTWQICLFTRCQQPPTCLYLACALHNTSRLY